MLLLIGKGIILNLDALVERKGELYSMFMLLLIGMGIILNLYALVDWEGNYT